jgi:hypothetical protein
MASPRDGFGGADAAPNGMKYEIIRLKENVTSIPLRILPAMHSLRTANKWADFHSIHFGFKGLDFKDKTKTRMRPFECIQVQDRKTKVIKVNCDQCNLMRDKEKLRLDALAHYTAEAKKQGILDEKGVKAFCEPYLKTHNEWARNFNKDSKWYINCVTVEGKMALLQIPHKMKVALDKEIDDLRAKGLEPISNFDTGVYFTFLRTGTFSSSAFTCKVYMEGDVLAPRVKLAPLSDEILTKALSDLPDLATGVTRKLSADQITLLSQCSGEPAEVDSIMGMTQLPDELEGGGDSGGDAPPPPPSSITPKLPPVTPFQPKPAAAAAPAPAPLPPAAAPALAPAAPAPTEAEIRAKVEGELRAKMQAQMEAQLKAEMAKLTAPPAAAPAPAAPVAPAPAQAAPAAPAPSSVPTGFDPMDPNLSPEAFANAFPPLSPR